MIVANALAFAFGKLTIKNQNTGAATPLGLSAGAAVGILCFGHILGTGAILGLTNLGVL
jgi:photosystem I subunit X